jgi:hypothetical protein
MYTSGHNFGQVFSDLSGLEKHLFKTYLESLLDMEKKKNRSPLRGEADFASGCIS